MWHACVARTGPGLSLQHGRKEVGRERTRSQTIKIVFFLSQLSFECMKNMCTVRQDNHWFDCLKV